VLKISLFENGLGNKETCVSKETTEKKIGKWEEKRTEEN
jgi:hypothetical protein